MTTTPPAGSTEAPSVVGDPTLRTFTAVIFSGMKLGLVLELAPSTAAGNASQTRIWHEEGA